jgi:hypothetical protein
VVGRQRENAGIKMMQLKELQTDGYRFVIKKSDLIREIQRGEYGDRKE